MLSVTNCHCELKKRYKSTENTHFDVVSVLVVLLIFVCVWRLKHTVFIRSKISAFYVDSNHELHAV